MKRRGNEKDKSRIAERIQARVEHIHPFLRALATQTDRQREKERWGERIYACGQWPENKANPAATTKTEKNITENKKE